MKEHERSKYFRCVSIHFSRFYTSSSTLLYIIWFIWIFRFSFGINYCSSQVQLFMCCINQPWVWFFINVKCFGTCCWRFWSCELDGNQLPQFSRGHILWAYMGFILNSKWNLDKVVSGRLFVWFDVFCSSKRVSLEIKKVTSSLSFIFFAGFHFS